jgi:ribosomal-protein-alanine N-acetyltransferase
MIGCSWVRDMDWIETERLVLRPPRLNDVQAIFDRYASDPEVTRYLAWSRHRSLAETRAFVKFSNDLWARWSAGPMVAISRDDGTLLGGSGLMIETPDHASTGYVFARDAWGKGYATECLRAMLDVAVKAGVQRVTAECHAGHAASRRVLDKCGFQQEPTTRQMVFPNLSSEPQDVLLFSRSVRER